MEESKLIELVDKLISCELPDESQKDSQILNNIVSNTQKHGHTPSCLKYHGNCRYGFPKLPSMKTIIAKPLPETMDKEERQKKLADAKVTLQKAMQLLENDKELDENISLADFVKLIDPQLSIEQYMDQISITERGKSIILKRTVKERMINNYNKEMIIAWNANMDIQLALDPYAVITYMVGYINKNDTGLTKFMKEAITKVPSNEAKEKLRALKTAYLTHRQIGASEAVYRVISSMRLKDSNITCIFVASGFPENRSVFYKKINDEPNCDHPDHQIVSENEDEDEDEDGDEDEDESKEEQQSNKGSLSTTAPIVEIEGCPGKFKSATSVIDKYAARPNYLKEMCLAQFAIGYTYQAKPPKTAVFDEDGNSNLKSMQKIFDQDTCLPRHIKLKDNLGNMRLRFQPAVLRIHTSKNKEGHEKYYSEMLLFSSWTDEENELSLQEVECLAEYIKRKDEIESNRQAIYPGEATIDYLESADLEILKPTHLLETLNGQGEQENSDDLEEEGIIDDPDFESFAYTGNLNLDGQQKFEDFKYKKICLPSDFELNHITRQLVPEQMNPMRKVLSACKDIAKSEKYPQIKIKPVRLILHGGAGVGKSKTIKAMALQAEKALRKAGHHPNHPRVLLAAFTGKAASLIGM